MLVIGTSGRGSLEIDPTQTLPSWIDSSRIEEHGKVGIVFGPGEKLLNDELRECEILVSIPTWEGYPIMNLSHAVAVICILGSLIRTQTLILMNLEPYLWH